MKGQHPKEDDEHRKLMSDDRSAYACVPKGAHFRNFDTPKEYGCSIAFARDNYEGGITIKPDGKRHSY